jgi:hypothetical protein
MRRLCAALLLAATAASEDEAPVAGPDTPLEAGLRVEEWLAAGSAASYAKLELVRSLNIPVVVNLVFAGFDKNGNLGVNLSQEKLERWFEHLEAANPYLRVPADDADSAKEYEFERAAVRFRYSFNVVKVSPNVSSVLDTVLYRAMRPTDPLEVLPQIGPEASFSQVEADVMEEALESLAIELGLEDAFTLFVLNPRRDSHGKMYGYRSGFSRAEKAILFADDNFRTTYHYGTVIDSDGAARGEGVGVADALERKFAEELQPDPPANDPLTALNSPQLQWHEMEEASERWIAAQDARIGELDQAAEMAEQAAGAEGSVYRRAVKMLEAGSAEKREIDAVFADSTSDNGVSPSLVPDRSTAPPSPRTLLLAYVVQFESAWRRPQPGRLFMCVCVRLGPLLGQRPRSPEDFDENCLVDNWVASDRLAWIDLTAGPFTWGPVSGGAGVRTHSTLPAVSEMVEEYYQSVDDTYEQPAGGTDEEGFQDFVNQIQAERDVVQMLYQRHCGSAAKKKNDPAAEARRAKMQAKVKSSHDRHMAAGKATPDAPKESFTGRPDLCEEIKARQTRLEAVLLKANAISLDPDPAEGPPKPAEKLAAMQDELKSSGGDEDNPIFTRGILGESDASFAIDRSLSHLAATISTTLRQLVTPVAAGREESVMLLRDEEYNPDDLFAERVAFHVFTITEHAISEPDVLRPRDDDGTGKKKQRSLDPKLQALKEELMQLALPSQEFSFSFATMALADDQALAVAYASSLRVHARAGQGGDVQDVLALDAAELVYQLQHRAEGADVLRSPSSRTRTIPIFIFRIDSDMPVFLEYPGAAGTPTVSVGLGGMVLAAESNHTSWQTPLSCASSCLAASLCSQPFHRRCILSIISHCCCIALCAGNAKPVSVDLRDATKPLLGATAHVLGGALPRHVAPAADGGATSDWLWATGDSPLVATSPCRASFGQVDADVIHRNYLAQALHVSLTTQPSQEPPPPSVPATLCHCHNDRCGGCTGVVGGGQHGGAPTERRSRWIDTHARGERSGCFQSQLEGARRKLRGD